MPKFSCKACSRKVKDRSYCYRCWPASLGRPPGGRKKKKPKRGKPDPYAPYRSRDTLLRSLGFKSYQEYLGGELWADIRDRVLVRDKRTCRTCGRKASQVHHGRYSRKALLGEELRDLYALCRGCRRRIEFAPSGEKRGLKAVGREYAKRRRRHSTYRYFNPVGKDNRDELTKEFLRIVRDY